MGSIPGLFNRPATAAVAAVVAALSADFTDGVAINISSSFNSRIPEYSTSLNHEAILNSASISKSWLSQITVRGSSSSSDGSDLSSSLASKLRNLSPGFSCPLPQLSSQLFDLKYTPLKALLPTASPAVLNLLYEYSNLNAGFEGRRTVTKSKPVSHNSDVVYQWHLPSACPLKPNGSDCCSVKSDTVVVLLGWLGAKQKHLKKYAEWYTSRGFHVLTFTFPMSDVVSYTPGGKAEQDVELLVNELAKRVEDQGRQLIFHSFSNTGWLTYGVILEKFLRRDASMIEKIKGCIIDSAPVAAPDPQVWASGFSAALLKKQSVATKGSSGPLEVVVDVASVSEKIGREPKPAVAEVALLLILEKLFVVVLNIPAVSKRLSDVLSLLSSQQPKCPQLYIYSSADRVIPARAVKSFVEQQRKSGHNVRACDFVTSPHVDHFRNNPALYSSQLTSFLEDVLMCSES